MRGNQLAFGSFGIKSLETHWITARQIEAARVAMTRYMQREGQSWIRIFPDKPITKKPADVRMGKGKGDPVGYVFPITPGRIIFEIEGVSYEMVDGKAMSYILNTSFAIIMGGKTYNVNMVIECEYDYDSKEKVALPEGASEYIVTTYDDVIG